MSERLRNKEQESPDSTGERARLRLRDRARSTFALSSAMCLGIAAVTYADRDSKNLEAHAAMLQRALLGDFDVPGQAADELAGSEHREPERTLRLGAADARLGCPTPSEPELQSPRGQGEFAVQPRLSKHKNDVQLAVSQGEDESSLASAVAEPSGADFAPVEERAHSVGQKPLGASAADP